MESWLAADTIRRMGFGQVIAARHHTLIIERGVSLVDVRSVRPVDRIRIRGRHLRPAAAVSLLSLRQGRPEGLH